MILGLEMFIENLQVIIELSVWKTEAKEIGST